MQHPARQHKCTSIAALGPYEISLQTQLPDQLHAPRLTAQEAIRPSFDKKTVLVLRYYVPADPLLCFKQMGIHPQTGFSGILLNEVGGGQTRHSTTDNGHTQGIPNRGRPASHQTAVVQLLEPGPELYSTPRYLGYPTRGRHPPPTLDPVDCLPVAQ